MHEYAVEFDLSGVDRLPEYRVRDLAQAFGRALHAQAAGVSWVSTYVDNNTLGCVYHAPNEEAVHAAARHAHLRPDRVFEVNAAAEAHLPGEIPAA